MTSDKGQKKALPLSPAATFYIGAMGALGASFGLLAEKRPFGDDLFAHPLLVLAALAAGALLVLRAVWARPVTEILPERVLLFGSFVAVAMFLIGNFAGVHVLSIR